MSSDDKQVVKVGMTIHKISKFQPTDTKVNANLEIYFTYPEENILSIFEKYSNEEKKEFRSKFKFPFLISNALEVNINSESFSILKIEEGNDINYHGNKNSDNENTIIYRLEKYMINCELEVVNFTHLLPFNKIIVPINVITNGSPGTEEIQLVEEFTILRSLKDFIDKKIIIKPINLESTISDYIFRFEDDNLNKIYGYHHIEILNETRLGRKKVFNINCAFDDYDIIQLNHDIDIKLVNKWPFKYKKPLTFNDNSKFFKQTSIVWGKFITSKTVDRVYQRITNRNYECCSLNNMFDNKWDWYNIIHPVESKHNKDYSRIYFLLSHSFSIMEDIIKYYFIPTILSITILLFYDCDLSSLSGLFPTIMLGNIALLFIQPETGKFTFNERSVHLNIAITIIFSILKIASVSVYFSNIIWILIVVIINLINLIHNIIVSNNKMNQIDKVFNLEEMSTIEELFNGDDSKLSCGIINNKNSCISNTNANNNDEYP